ncbi:MAG: tRNA preQ1(34) S-adenosylmethionine ribosyltransferase-isomerase QueA [Desulfuromonadales bacterium]|nr:tRNA preQ1(34) S-adenosylmethionine ribosyltransferase-isomerase QueA [Desulfuromonadales bacterium]
MLLTDFDYNLPEELVAQAPLAERSASRLLVVACNGAELQHSRFADLVQWLRPGDLLVRNETRVIPARLLGRKESGGRVELLLVRPLAGADTLWQCLGKSSKPLRQETAILFAGGVRATIEAVLGDGQLAVRFDGSADFAAFLDEHGHIPLPPYIRRADSGLDRDRYQTVFARRPGAVAAPTAGLHFTDQTFAELAAAGVEVCGVTLHVGPGTFLPVRCDDLDKHRMHAEVYEVSAEAARMVNRARAEGRRIIALGTTVVRTLEAASDDEGRLRAGSGETDLFIRPGYRFRVVDGLITNFHLPRSTLLVLVAAFAGRERILNAYRQAVTERYRFFSYGDCMLILGGVARGE